MNSRSKKYFNKSKSAKKAGTTANPGKKSSKQNSPVQKNTATQDDTGGGNESGKRIDDN